MTADALVDAFRSRGIELYVADGRLRYRGPVGALDAPLRCAAAEHRAELLAALGAPPSASAAGAADAEVRLALAVIDRALSAAWLRSAQRNVLRVFRRQVCDYHARHDPLLFGFAVWVEAQVAGWNVALV
jgi:hypothetical protein